MEQLTRIFYDFKTLHFASISHAVHERIFHAGGFRSFPYGSQCLICNLSYRPDCLGNPACAFHVESLTLLPHSTLDQGATDAIKASRTAAEAVKARRRVDEPEFIDILTLMFSIGNHSILESFAVQDKLWLIEDGLGDPDFFIKELQIMAERGHAYRDLGVGSLDIGRMKKDGNKWDWVKLTKEELRAGGYTHKVMFIKQVEFKFRRANHQFKPSVIR
jgi:hypothetical protein